MRWNLFLSALVLPLQMLVTLPTLLLLATKQTPYKAQIAPPDSPQFWGGLSLVMVGLFFSLWSVNLFARLGRGTPAPWDPPKRLVALGPYQHMRNPMMVGVFFMLLGESLFFWSLPLAYWSSLIIFFYMLYIPLIEEVNLAMRFGRTYERYKQHVPRWLPRLTAWDGAAPTAPNDIRFAPPSMLDPASQVATQTMSAINLQHHDTAAHTPTEILTAPALRVPMANQENEPTIQFSNLPLLRGRFPDCPLVHLWKDLISKKKPSDAWLERCSRSPGARISPMQFAWNHALFGEHMILILKRVEHPQVIHLQREFWWLFREYEVANRAQRSYKKGDQIAPYVREKVPLAPPLDRVVEAMKRPQPRCPIAEMLSFLQFSPERLQEWAQKWGQSGRDPLQEAWRHARSAASMSLLIEHIHNPRKAMMIQAQVITHLGGTLEGFLEEECAEALRQIYPAPPTFQHILSQQNELRSQLLKFETV